MYHSHMELSSVLPPEISLNPGANWISLRSNVAVSSLVLRIDCGRVKTGGPLAVSETLRKMAQAYRDPRRPRRLPRFRLSLRLF